MGPMRITAVLSGMAISLGWGSGLAADKVDVGKREYTNSCAVCHGLSGKGDGPLAGMIETRIPDLTAMAKRNNGVFPLARVYETIDGSAVVKAHGPRDMPVWGARYRTQAGEYYVDIDYDPQAVIRARILAVAEYIHRLQAK